MKKQPKLNNTTPEEMEHMFFDLKKEKNPIQRSQIFFNILKDFIAPLLAMGNFHKTDTPAECIAFVALMEFMDTNMGRLAGKSKYDKLLFIKNILEEEIDRTDEMKLFKDLDSKPETLH